jgi:hypothetical protein
MQYHSCCFQKLILKIWALSIETKKSMKYHFLEGFDLKKKSFLILAWIFLSEIIFYNVSFLGSSTPHLKDVYPCIPLRLTNP